MLFPLLLVFLTIILLVAVLSVMIAKKVECPRCKNSFKFPGNRVKCPYCKLPMYKSKDGSIHAAE